ncbi:D-alanyl-D-alanine carboxypeptidase [Glycomyces sambucus]|uniref:D-alanyl-D-alanine carboxypeptidase n=1 Tax=Glycomyces sambucus TaxID=380244 RepID=A0A1G9CBE4_9ACTN|nr:serine hydrolase domain-containing protein [Glycomyces sambucus]SDK49003.1 D-alanyl-D-alanine carboxypeptidase [Glycomyces sambucus]
MSNHTTTTDTTRPELQQVLQDMVDAGITGVQLRVSDEHGDWYGTAGTGELDGTEPPAPGAHFRIGSNTKTFTAVAVLALVAEGRIGLDEPVATHLPAFGFDERITVRMILQHTSGVFNFTGEYFEDGTFKPGITCQGQAWVEARFDDHTPESLVELALANEPRFAPGEDWSYSNTNYVIARLVVEAVTGRTLAEEIERTVLAPLGLKDTVVPGYSPEIPSPHLHAYYRYEEDGQEQIVDVSRQNPSWIATGGDMISTSADLQTFITGLVGGKLLPADLTAEMFTPEAKVGYGLGVFVQDTEYGKVITHNGGITGNAGLMYCSADGTRSFTAALNYVDDAAMTASTAFQAGLAALLGAVFAKPSA